MTLKLCNPEEGLGFTVGFGKALFGVAGFSQGSPQGA